MLRHLHHVAYSKYMGNYMAEGSNCPFKVYFEGKWPVKSCYNCLRLRPVKGTSSKVISFGFHLADLSAAPCSSGSLDSLLTEEKV